MAEQPSYSDFYQQLRSRVRAWLERQGGGRKSRWADYVLLAPDLFHLLCKLAADGEVPTGEKVKLAAAIAYFISPVDLLPEALVGPLGFLDDIALAAYVLNGIVNKAGPERVRAHWAGREDVLEVAQKVLAVADQMVGSGLWQRLKKRIG